MGQQNYHQNTILLVISESHNRVNKNVKKINQMMATNFPEPGSQLETILSLCIIRVNWCAEIT